MKYRKKPVVVDAWQYLGSLADAPNWLIEAVRADAAGTYPELYVQTLEGRIHISHGDYIIRGTAGEIYPCKPDIFHDCYEEVI